MDPLSAFVAVQLACATGRLATSGFLTTSEADLVFEIVRLGVEHSSTIVLVMGVAVSVALVGVVLGVAVVCSALSRVSRGAHRPSIQGSTTRSRLREREREMETRERRGGGGGRTESGHI